MVASVSIGSSLRVAALLAGLALATAPAAAASAPEARLVHCGADTCLRVSGRRPSADFDVRIAGRAVQVDGGRAWRVTIPLAEARGWDVSADGTMPLALIDRRDGTVRTSAVPLPPGALGRRVELASLVVSAR